MKRGMTLRLGGLSSREGDSLGEKKRQYGLLANTAAQVWVHMCICLMKGI